MEDVRAALAQAAQALSRPDRAFHKYRKSVHQSPCPGCSVLEVLSRLDLQLDLQLRGIHEAQEGLQADEGPEDEGRVRARVGRVPTVRQVQLPR